MHRLNTTILKQQQYTQILNSPDYLFTQSSNQNYSFDSIYKSFKTYNKSKQKLPSNVTLHDRKTKNEYGFFKNHMDFIKNQENKLEKIYSKQQIFKMAIWLNYLLYLDTGMISLEKKRIDKKQCLITNFIKRRRLIE